MTQPVYIIIDGNSFIHRAYHALPVFTNKAGFPTNIITGVCNMINKVLKGFEHEYAVVAFDARGKNFRHDMFEEYKANRDSMPDDMRVQLDPLKQIIDAWGLPNLTVSGVEADDSMSSMAIAAEKAGFKVIMVTSDKDMNQIVNENIHILDTKATDAKEKMLPLDIEGVKEKMGVYPNQVVDYLSLVGDTADNVPGVHKCGHKTAIKWIDEFGSVEGIKENSDQIKGKVGEYLKEAIESGALDLSYKLVTIKKDVDVGDVLSYKQEMNEEKLIELLNTYELRTFKKMLNLVDKNAESAETEFVEGDEAKDFAMEMHKASILFMETFNFKNDDYLLVSTKSNDSVYVLKASEHKRSLTELVNSFVNKNGYISSIDSKEVLKTIYKVVKDRKVFDILLDDARVVDYIQEGGRSKIATIEMLNDSHSNFNLSELRETFKLNGKAPKWKKMSFEETATVISEHVKICKHIINNKDQDFNLASAIMDNRILSVLAYVEYHGALLNVEHLNNYGQELDSKIIDIEKRIFDVAGSEFNISSPKQVSKVLFEDLAIPSKKKSTAEDVLLALVDDNPIVGDILKYRSLTKLRSTYVEGLLSRVDENNYIHTTYNSTLTATSRLSSTDPNLQNIPAKNEDGRKIRQAFIAKSGFKIVKLDYSQIELRILASISGDKKLMEAYKEGYDVHAITASEIFEINVEDVTYEQRRVGKTINFALIYGMSERRLAAELGIDKKVAKEYYRNYFRYYKEVKPYFEGELETARENLFVTTLKGRKIFTRDLKSPNPHARSHAEKAANNARIQGTAADIIKDAMIEVFRVLQESEIEANILLQVHDELVFEVHEEIAEAFAKQMKALMENTTTINVPLVVEYEIKDHY